MRLPGRTELRPPTNLMITAAGCGVLECGGTVGGSGCRFWDAGWAAGEFADSGAGRGGRVAGSGAGGDREETGRRLLALPGIGPWTAGYLAMRAFGDPDVLLPTDLAVRRGAAALGLPDDPKTLDSYADRWRPWRSYATIRLWRAA
ncbi:hypothetical protein GCM10027614_59820 [Micromonospora vulcania]